MTSYYIYIILCDDLPISCICIGCSEGGTEQKRDREINGREKGSSPPETGERRILTSLYILS